MPVTTNRYLRAFPASTRSTSLVSRPETVGERDQQRREGLDQPIALDHVQLEDRAGTEVVAPSRFIADQDLARGLRVREATLEEQPPFHGPAQRTVRGTEGGDRERRERSTVCGPTDRQQRMHKHRIDDTLQMRRLLEIDACSGGEQAGVEHEQIGRGAMLLQALVGGLGAPGARCQTGDQTTHQADQQRQPQPSPPADPELGPRP